MSHSIGATETSQVTQTPVAIGAFGWGWVLGAGLGLATIGSALAALGALGGNAAEMRTGIRPGPTEMVVKPSTSHTVSQVASEAGPTRQGPSAMSLNDEPVLLAMQPGDLRPLEIFPSETSIAPVVTDWASQDTLPDPEH